MADDIPTACDKVFRQSGDFETGFSLSFIQEIRNRRVLPAVGVYVGASWVLIEILDRLVERYLLSPYITDIAFWGLYSLLPAVLLIAWTHGRPGKDKTTTVEKVGVPINIIATLGLLITVFGGKDLNSTANLVTFNNELGVEEKHYVPRDSYRRRMAVFFWENKTSNEDFDWLQYGIADLLSQDLQQSPFIMVSSPFTNISGGFYPRMKQAGFEEGVGLPLNLMREIADEANRAYFIEGEFRQASDIYELTARIWNTENLSLVGEAKESGIDLLSVVDRISADVRSILDIPSGKGRLAEDLPLSETYGESQQAFRSYIGALNALLLDNDFDRSNRLHDAALEADSNFVLSWLHKGTNHFNLGDIPAAQEALAEAQKRDYRLPTRDRATLKALSYRLAGEQDKLGTFLRMQVRLTGDAASQRHLANFLLITGRLEEAKEEYKQVLAKDATDLAAYLNLATLERATGDVPAAIGYTETYLESKPQDTDALIRLGDLRLEIGDLDGARENYFQAELLEDPPLASTLKLSMLAVRQGEWGEARQLLDQARQLDAGAAGQSQVLKVEGLLEIRLGRIERAIELLHQQAAFNQEFVAPIDQLVSFTFPFVGYNLALGRYDEAEQALNAASEQMPPPMDQFLAFSEVALLAKKGEFEQARKALERGRQIIEMFEAEYIAFQVPLSEGLIAQQMGDFSLAAERYEQSLEQVKGSILGSELLPQMAPIFGICAEMYVRAGNLKKAQQILDEAFPSDNSEPSLWVARAMLQKESGLEQMAEASVNYALAIWSDADPDYREYQKALALQQTLNSQLTIN